MRLLVLTLPLPWLLCLRLGSVQTAELACVAHQQIALMRCAIQAGPVAIRRISADFAQLAVAQTWGEKAKIV